jgi:hypothetical protein
MKLLHAACVLACLPLSAQPSPPASDFPPLFDGVSLAGWVPRGGGVYRVEDGAIVGETGDGRHGWLCTTKTYGDFHLELDVKTDLPGNSGIQIRSHIDDKDVMVGYQIEIDSSPRAWSGGLYEQGRRGWLQNLENNPEGRKAFKVGDWNRYRIACAGDSIRTWVNGVPIADWVDSLDLEGVIALQVHSGKEPPVRVRWRDIRLKDLGRRSWKPLWNGKTLDGWHAIGKGTWTIEDGAVVGRHDAAEKEFGHLVSDATYRDFTARITYQAVRGNSGFYFRIAEEGHSGVSGFQAEIDPERDAGGLYETNGRAWVVKPAPEDVAKWHKPGEWNIMTVSAHGSRIVVHVNGHRSAEIRDEKGRREGRLALQVHGGQDCEVRFKSVEILGEPER